MRDLLLLLWVASFPVALVAAMYSQWGVLMISGGVALCGLGALASKRGGT